MPISRPAQLTIPLDIPNVDICNTQSSADGKLVISVESRQETTTCGICQRQIQCNYGHGQEISLRHLPILGRETYIRLRPKRGQCRHCQYQPTTTQVLDWYEPRSPHTKAYDRHLLKQLSGSTIEAVSRKENVGYDAIVGAIQRQLVTEVNWDQISHLGTVGLDEIALKKGHKGYVAVITARPDNDSVVILAILPDRKKASVANFFATIPERLRRTIHTICSDMWEGYVQAVTEYIEQHQLTAQLVIDRFHVATNYRDSFDELRKQEMRRLKQELSAETYQADFSGALWLLRHNHNNLDEEQREQLRRLLAHSPQLQQAYSLRQELTAIFELKLSHHQAKTRLSKWAEKVERSELTCFDKFIKTLRTHLDRIANYFVRRANSGFVEGLNNKIQLIKRRCYGIRKVGTLFQRLWLELQGYALFA